MISLLLKINVFQENRCQILIKMKKIQIFLLDLNLILVVLNIKWTKLSLISFNIIVDWYILYSEYINENKYVKANNFGKFVQINVTDIIIFYYDSSSTDDV